MLDAGTGASGIPLRVTSAFWAAAAAEAAVIVTVPDCPGRIVLGLKVAVVPGGSPLILNATKYVGAEVELNPVEN